MKVWEEEGYLYLSGTQPELLRAVKILDKLEGKTLPFVEVELS